MRIWGLFAAALCCASLGAGAGRAAAAGDFEHMRTGFVLTGMHERIPCESCHVGGVFEGTPRSCAICHVPSGPWGASFKPANHLPTSNACEDCHITSSWAFARFEHSGISGGCVRCHNGGTAQGKTPNHIASGNDCETCHRTLAWSPATFDHSTVTGSCASCHNGAFATGKPANHVPTSADCGDCHGTRNWSATSFDHAGITTNCFSCHNGSTATGKGPRHIASTNTCEDCHDTRSWSSAHFDHAGVLGNCGSCHNGTTATGKSPGHFITTLECNECHSTAAWDPIRFTHSSPNYPGDHAGPLACDACHVGHAQTVAWPFGSYQPDCAACHANDFKPGPHKKHENPDVRYTVGELRDCTGACHVYTDSSLTTIKDRRSGEHRVNRRDW